MSHRIETVNGLWFDFDEPLPGMIVIDDIATGLSNVCRYAGQVRRFYSVAEHAVLVYRMLKDTGFPSDVCFAGLHHDSHEAYLGDVPSPYKQTLGPERKTMEYVTDVAISEALGVDLDLMRSDAVKSADEVALAYEAVRLKPSMTAQRDGHVVTARADQVPAFVAECWSPPRARAQFLYAHGEASWLAQNASR